MDNLLSGAIGGLIGTLLSSAVAFWIFMRQVRIESNRIFLQNLIQVLQRVYMLGQSGKLIPSEDIDFLISFGAIALDDFDELTKEIDRLKETILQYNQGVQDTIKATSASHLEVTMKARLTAQIKSATTKIRDLT